MNWVSGCSVHRGREEDQVAVLFAHVHSCYAVGWQVEWVGQRRVIYYDESLHFLDEW
jgi:hypothetical protein